MKITREDIQRKESALGTLLETMEVPEMRRDTSRFANIRWLGRNLKINNRNHPMLETAVEVVEFLMRNR